MEKKCTNYNKQNDVSVLSLSTHEILKINPQISRTRVTDSEGEHNGPDELILVFSASEPTPIEERELCVMDPNEPLIVLLESKNQVDHLIEVLQKLRFQLYGPDLSFEKIKN
jgi:hypothetical protein